MILCAKAILRSPTFTLGRLFLLSIYNNIGRNLVVDRFKYKVYNNIYRTYVRFSSVTRGRNNCG
jgi:hypothetical protein